MPLQRTNWGKMRIAGTNCYLPLHYCMHVLPLCMCHHGPPRSCTSFLLPFNAKIVYIQVSRFLSVLFHFGTLAAIQCSFLEKSLYAPCARSCKGARGLWHSPAALQVGVQVPIQAHQAKATHHAWTPKGPTNVYIYFDLSMSYILLLADLHFCCIARESDTTTAPLYHSCSSGLSHSLMHPCSA